mmetsp:Transcript_12040/g.46727  ORF Transcript_12040/g.46727 Transcript_12040/m.46727 type:complete len:269 (+) Transcript_12040:1759-2565(+)
MPRGGLLSSVCSSKPSYPSFAFTQRVHQETRSLSCQRGEIGLTSRMRDSTLSSSRGGVGHAKRPHRLHLHLTFSSSSSSSSNNNNNNNNKTKTRMRKKKRAPTEHAASFTLLRTACSSRCPPAAAAAATMTTSRRARARPAAIPPSARPRRPSRRWPRDRSRPRPRWRVAETPSKTKRESRRRTSGLRRRGPRVGTCCPRSKPTPSRRRARGREGSTRSAGRTMRAALHLPLPLHLPPLRPIRARPTRRLGSSWRRSSRKRRRRRRRG